MSTGNSIRNITDTATFKAFLNDDASKNQLYVIDFHATWCKPCKRVSPLYDKLCEGCDNVTYFKCDVDEAEDLAEVFEVKSVPTFIFAYNRNILDKMEGANIDKIKAKVDELVNAPDRKYTLLNESNNTTTDNSDEDSGEDDGEDNGEDDGEDSGEDHGEDRDVDQGEDNEDDHGEDGEVDHGEDSGEDDDGEVGEEDDGEDHEEKEEDGPVVGDHSDEDGTDDTGLDDLSREDLKGLVEDISDENNTLRKENDRLMKQLGRLKKLLE